MTKQHYLAALLLPFCLSAHAGGDVVEEAIIIEEESSWFDPLISLSGGVAVAAVGESEGFYSINNDTYYGFDLHRQRQRHGTWGVFVGNALHGEEQREMHFGIAYYELDNKKVEGRLSEITLSTLNNYDYSYDVLGRQLLFEMKLSQLISRRVRPYFEAGAGWSFNRVSDFTTTVYGVPAAPIAFKEESNNSFTYRFGAGLDMDIMPHVRLGLGYRFINWGKADLGNGIVPATAMPLPRSLKQENLYSNGAEAQLTFIL